jgi:hypothetical protein
LLRDKGRDKEEVRIGPTVRSGPGSPEFGLVHGCDSISPLGSSPRDPMVNKEKAGG